MGGAPKLAAATAAAVLVIGLAACGSDDSTTTAGSTTTNTTASKEGSATNAQEKGNGGHKKAGQAKGSTEEGSASSGPKVSPAPLKVSGGGSEQFRTKGGDNSVQEFGEESDESELQQAAEAVHGFYVARVEGEWAKACSYLSKSMAQQLEQLGSQSKQFKDKGCASILNAFTRPLSGSLARETTVVDAGSLRTEGEQSFLIYYGPEKTVYAMPMKKEGGEWKVGSISGDALS